MTAPEVSALVERAAECVRAEGRPGVADDLLQKKDAPSKGLPFVIVAGEDKRGKSSLVNALLGRPDLSPVGVEVVTGAPISFSYADPEEAAIMHYGETTSVPVEFETGRSLATVQGNPGNAENIRAVQLGIPCKLLEKITLVDTPGVGGLQSGHAELTLQSLQSADALLFVVEAGAQFRGPELEFLRRAAARIDTVILALTKIDLNRGWRSILQDNLAILREKAPRFANCPVVPVSSLLAIRALQCKDPADAQAMREESGFSNLETTLTDHVIERASVLGDVNLLREAMWPLAVANRAIGEQLAALSTGGTSRAGLEAEQQRLRELGESKAAWPRHLDTEIRKLTLERSEEVSLGLVEIRRRYDERLKDPSKQDRQSLPGELVADLTALAGKLNEEAANRLIGLVEEVLEDIDSASDLRESIRAVTEGNLDEQLGSINIGSYSLTHYDRLSILSSFSSGRSLSTLITGSGLGLTAGALLAPPIGIAIGIGLGGFYAYQAFRVKGRSLFQTEFKEWMTEQCNQTQVTVTTTFQREIIDLQEEMREVVRGALVERERQIATSLKESKQLLDAEESKQAAGKQELQARSNTVRGIQKEISTLLGSLSATASAPAPAAQPGSPAESVAPQQS